MMFDCYVHDCTLLRGADKALYHLASLFAQVLFENSKKFGEGELRYDNLTTTVDNTLLNWGLLYQYYFYKRIK